MMEINLLIFELIESLYRSKKKTRVRAFLSFFQQHGDLLLRPKLLKSSLIVRLAREFSLTLRRSIFQQAKYSNRAFPMHFYFYTTRLLICGKSFCSDERFIINSRFLNLSFILFIYLFFQFSSTQKVNYCLNMIIKFLLFAKTLFIS